MMLPPKRLFCEPEELELAITCTLKVSDAEFPAESLAEQVTVVVPTGNKLPEAGTHVANPAPSTRSDVVGVEKVTRAPALLPALVEIFAIGEMTGGVVSRTVTVKEAFEVLPFESVAE